MQAEPTKGEPERRHSQFMAVYNYVELYPRLTVLELGERLMALPEFRFDHRRVASVYDAIARGMRMGYLEMDDDRVCISKPGGAPEHGFRCIASPTGIAALRPPVHDLGFQMYGISDLPPKESPVASLNNIAEQGREGKARAQCCRPERATASTGTVCS